MYFKELLLAIGSIILTQECQVSGCLSFREEIIVPWFFKLSTCKRHIFHSLPYYGPVGITWLCLTSRDGKAWLYHMTEGGEQEMVIKILVNKTNDDDCQEYWSPILSSLFSLLHKKHTFSLLWVNKTPWISQCSC